MFWKMLKRERLRILLVTCIIFAINTQTESSTTCHGVKYTQKIGEEIIVISQSVRL